MHTRQQNPERSPSKEQNTVRRTSSAGTSTPDIIETVEHSALPARQRQKAARQVSHRLGNRVLRSIIQRQEAPPAEDQQADVDQADANNPTDEQIAQLLQSAEDTPYTTMQQIERDYPDNSEQVFARVIQLKEQNDGEADALNLQSLMNPPSVDPDDLVDAVEAYREIGVQLTLTDPDSPADARVTVDMNMELQTPYDISSRRPAAGGGSLPNANADGAYPNVRWAKGDAVETEDAMQEYLENHQLNTLSQLYFDTYHQILQQQLDELQAEFGDQPAAQGFIQQEATMIARGEAEAAVAEQAQELISSAQIGVDCSGMVMRVMEETMPDAFDWITERARAQRGGNRSDDWIVRNATNVRAITDNVSGGSAGDANDLSVEWEDLQTAVPGLILQIGTGHVGGIIDNNVYTLNNLPDAISEEQENIINELFPDREENAGDEAESAEDAFLSTTQVRVIKYYHSIDAQRADDGANRYTNSNLPGPHIAHAVFTTDADSIDDDCYKVEPGGVNVNFTGLYVPRQRELVQVQQPAEGENAGNNGGGE